MLIDAQSAMDSNNLHVLVTPEWQTLITKLIFLCKNPWFYKFIIFCMFIVFYKFFDMLIPTLNYQELKKKSWHICFQHWCDIGEPINTLISYNMKHQPTESIDNQQTWNSMFWHNLSIAAIH